MSEVGAILLALITAVPTTLAALAALRATKRVEGTLVVAAENVAETAERGRVTRLAGEARAKKMESLLAHILTEVQTLNGKSLAELADAIETRRITDLPVSDRTEGDKRHVGKIPLTEEPK